MAKEIFRSRVEWTGSGVKSVAKSGKHQVVIDEPPSLGGDDQGPNPVELILAGLGGCLNVLISAFAPKHGVELESVTTTVEGDLDPDGFFERAPVPYGFQEIRYRIDLVSASPRENIDRLLEHAQRVWPVKDTLRGVPVVNVTAPVAATASVET